MTDPKITIEVVRLSAASAELLVRAEFAADPGPDVELRGRLMGPRCPGVSTIEVAYPLQAMPAVEPNCRSVRVIIPEPNLWDTERPFVYWGPVEVWRDNHLVASQQIDIGIRSGTKHEA